MNAHAPREPDRVAEEIAVEILAGACSDVLNAVLTRCGEDSDLIAKVLSCIGRIEDSPEPDPRIGAEVGPYRLLRVIGIGGNGAVYFALRQQDLPPRQFVAIKMIRPRIPVTGEVLARFARERELVARLTHNYIVKLYHAGGGPFGPYFAMEYVRGTGLAEYCDDNRLTIRQRLDLVLKICEAVQHLHRHLIVHRDLKPGNVMVQRDGTPKLLDFGIAELMEPESMGLLPLVEEHRKLTPGFAAPELCYGDPWLSDTASDVYSLGAILFLLLTGTSPASVEGTGDQPPAASDHVSSAHASVCRERDAPALRKRLRGDLDAIVAKAMSRTPADRYPNAQELAADIQDHLRWHPVAARLGDGWSYRARRFFRRNRTPAIAGAVLFASLSSGLGVSLYQRHQAVQQRKLALQRLQTLTELSEELKREMARIGPETRRANATFYSNLAAKFQALGEKEPDHQSMFYGTALKLELAARQQWEAGGDHENAEKSSERIGVLNAARVRDSGRPLDVPDLPESTAALAETYRVLAELLAAAGDDSGAVGARRICSDIVLEIQRRGPGMPLVPGDPVPFCQAP